jgi:hypothetical protein
VRGRGQRGRGKETEVTSQPSGILLRQLPEDRHRNPSDRSLARSRRRAARGTAFEFRYAQVRTTGRRSASNRVGAIDRHGFEPWARCILCRFSTIGTTRVRCTTSPPPVGMRDFRPRHADALREPASRPQMQHMRLRVARMVCGRQLVEVEAFSEAAAGEWCGPAASRRADDRLQARRLNAWSGAWSG